MERMKEAKTIALTSTNQLVMKREDGLRFPLEISIIAIRHKQMCEFLGAWPRGIAMLGRSGRSHSKS